MGYIYARPIHKGLKTLTEVPTRYTEATKAAYLDLYAVDLGA